MSQNVEKVSPVTGWRSEWLAENLSYIYKLSMEPFFKTQRKFYDRYFEWWQANKKKRYAVKVLSENVSKGQTHS